MPRENDRKLRYMKALNQIKDIQLKSVVKEIWDCSASNIGCQHPKRFGEMEAFCNVVKSLSLKDMDWFFLCKLVEDNNFGYQCMRLLYILLRDDLYCGMYKTELQELGEHFDIRKNGLRTEWYRHYFSYSRITYAHYSKTSVSRRLVYVVTDNRFLRKLLFEFCDIDRGDAIGNSGRTYQEIATSRDWFFENINLLFGCYVEKIRSVEDFNYEVFKYAENSVIKHAPEKVLVLRKLYRFFAFVIEAKREGRDFFSEQDPIDYSMLKRDDYAKCVLEGYTYVYYNPNDSVPDSDKWLLNINGFDRGTTVCRANQTVLYNFSKIESPFYRELAKEYFWHDNCSNFHTKYERFISLVKVINLLASIKKRTGAKETLITINETSHIRMLIQNSTGSAATKSSQISTLKSFLLHLQEEEKIEVEYYALEYLKMFTFRNSSKAHAISERDLELLNRVMMEKAGESIQNSYYYVIFHILLQTEFRLSQVCHLLSGCVVPTVNKNQYVVTCSKTSNAQCYEAVVSDYTKDLIFDAERISASIREECSIQENRKYLFLLKNTEKQFVPVRAENFRAYMAKCCHEAGIQQYSPSNIRDFHMTKAEEEILRKGYSDIWLKSLSGHSHVDMTRNHYVEERLTQIIENMYGIVIGDVDVNGNIVDAIENDINDKKHMVEGGCGHCGVDSCVDNSMISCLLCKDFYTTVDNIEGFRNLMNRLNSMIGEKSWEHDKEDIVNKKRLVAAYIRALETRLAELKGVKE